jgi:uncharacterized membrane protein HdeD (DUF308 family)
MPLTVTPPPTKRARRQRRTALAIAAVLILAGVAVLAFLPRVPTPTRLLTGFTDILLGAFLIVLVLRADD